MSDFPSISSSPELEDFVDEYPPDSVSGASYASGYPLVDVKFTLLLKGFKRRLRHVSEADKDSILGHYEDNRGNSFNWADVRAQKRYEVIYDYTRPPPSAKLDGRNDQFLVEIYFLQVSSTVTDITTTTTAA